MSTATDADILAETAAATKKIIKRQQVAVIPPQPVSESGRLAQMIDKVPLDGSVDLKDVKELFAIKREMLRQEAEQAFNTAINRVQAQIKPILRDKKNANHYRFICHVSHVAGHKSDYHVDMPADLLGPKGNANKTATHAYKSTLTYSRRALIEMIFNLATVDQDDDGNAAGGQLAGPVTDEQLTQIQARINAVGADPARFCTKYGIGSIDELPAAKFAGAMAALKKFGESKVKS